MLGVRLLHRCRFDLSDIALTTLTTTDLEIGKRCEAQYRTRPSLVNLQPIEYVFVVTLLRSVDLYWSIRPPASCTTVGYWTPNHAVWGHDISAPISQLLLISTPLITLKKSSRATILLVCVCLTSWLMFAMPFPIVKTTTGCLLAAFISLLASASAQVNECYWRSHDAIAPESSSGWFMCYNTALTVGGAQTCCLNNSQCGEDGLCRAARTNGTTGYNYYVGGKRWMGGRPSNV